MNASYADVIQALFEPTDTVCFAMIDEGAGVEHGFTSMQKALETEDVYNYLQSRNTTASIYFGLNPYKDELRGAKKGRTEENVAKIKRLYADADDNGVEAFNKLKTSTTLPPPHVVLETSPNKFQFIWNIDGLDQPTAKRMLKAIATELGTDPSVAETARVFRLPGFVNRKKKYTGEPIVKLIGDILNRRPYRPEDFKLNLSAMPAETKLGAEEWLSEPFVHGQLDNQIVRLIGHYVTSKNISDADEMYALVTAKMEANGCVDRDGVTPYRWNDARVRELCQLKTKNWKTGEEQKREAISKALMESAKIAEQATVAAQQDEVEVLRAPKEPYPVFPSYVMAGTSIYENFVKPWCEKNSRIDYFSWLPATAMLLNYIGTKIKTKGLFAERSVNGSIFMVLIGKRGQTNKSSSVDDGFRYFNYIGCLTHDDGLKTADGKTVVFTAGSAEGLGGDMQKTNAKNVLLYYDELEELTKKAKIDGSTLRTGLLKLYESKKYANTVKATKEKFSILPDSYCASLIACTTPEMFGELWGTLCGDDTGLNDRFFFVLEPQQLPEYRMMVDINIFENATVTRQLIDRAVQKGFFEFEEVDTHPKFIELGKKHGTRCVERAKKWALAIAIDLGLDFVDNESLSRGADIVFYEIAVKKYLKTRESKTREAELQNSIKHHLRMNNGELPTRTLRTLCHGERYGSTAWGQAFYGLQKMGDIRTIGTGTKGDPQITQLIHDDAVDQEAA